MSDRYYQILGINRSAGIKEIRKAYRKKAAALHPDVNKSPNAHEEFLFLREAYEYVLEATKQREAHAHSDTPSWNEENISKARTRAEDMANMAYDDFRRTEEMKINASLEILSEYANVIFMVILCSVVAIFMTMPFVLIFGEGAYLIGVGLIGLILFFARDKLRVAGLNFSMAKRAFRFLWSYIPGTAWIIPFMFLQALVYFRIGFHTLIPLLTLSLIYLSSIVVVYIYRLFFIETGKRFRESLWQGPLVISLFLVFNYMFSSGPEVETYRFKKETQQVRKGVQESSLIILEGNKYDAYTGVRLFFDFDEIREKNRIALSFEEGLFGIRVLKSYKLSQVIFYSNGTSEIVY